MVRVKSIIFLAIAFSALLTGCTSTYVIDHLEAYVAVGFGQRKEIEACPLKHNAVSIGTAAPCWDSPVDSVLNRPFLVWFKVISSRDLSRALAGRVVQLSVVDSRGIYAEGAVIAPEKVISDLDGYSAEPVYFTAHKLGVFRIKAVYEDYGATVWSYSPPISILSK